MAKRVLVVDDEKLIVKGIRFSLESEGMKWIAHMMEKRPFLWPGKMSTIWYCWISCFRS